MGQTLTHGVYLPDEGERNCYSGLASNWSILDGAVGTIAEHTAALAGKAPAVHTHTVSDITDFPAYGNTAGTICEGNDSRLSDARTPVAHTHTKSDVTDLLNSNFIPSANNSYDLGSSSYQWNNVYSKRVNTQTLNGINPGALSLPTKIYSDIDKTNWVVTGSPFNYTPVLDGWVEINLNARANDFNRIAVENVYYRHSSEAQAGNRVMLTFPVRANETYEIRLWGASISQARFIKCEGNV